MPKRTFSPLMSRRCFLRTISVIAAGGLLAACAVGEEGTLPDNLLESAINDVTLPMPQSVTQAAAQQDDAELPGFLALSALLTGVDTLDPMLGAIYLQSLRASSAFSVTITSLLEEAQAGLSAPATTIEELESSGIFENNATRELADKITEYWYTGIYETEQGEQVVATHVNALAWQTLTFTKPSSLCGSYGFWTEPPEAALD
jgi:hypothetical protein